MTLKGRALLVRAFLVTRHSVAARISLKSCVVIIAAWLLVRLALMPVVYPDVRGDAIAYLAATRDFLSGHGLASARRSPAYVTFLAGTLWLGTRGIYALQSGMTLAVALFTHRRLGFWQGLVIAACPFFVMCEWSLMTETLCISLLWCGWLLIFWRRSPYDVWVGGLFLGLAVLTRPILILVPLMAALILLLWHARRSAAIVIAVAYLPAVVVLPQAGGNSFLGLNLWIGTWETDAHWRGRSIEDWPKEANLRPENRVALVSAYRSGNDQPFFNAAIERYRAEPMKVLTAWVVRYRFLWMGTRTELTRPTPHTASWFVFKGSMWLLNSSTIFFGVLGSAFALRRRDREAVLIAPVVYIAIIYIPFHNNEMRYSMPAMPFLLSLSTYFFKSIIENHFQNSESKSFVSFALDNSEKT